MVPSFPRSMDRMPSECVSTTVCDATSMRSVVNTSSRMSPVLYAPKNRSPPAPVSPHESQNTAPVGAMVVAHHLMGSAGLAPFWFVLSGAGGGVEHVSSLPHP